MNRERLKKYSKFLSYLLRHHPEELDLEMDRGGWVPVDALLEGLRQRDASWSMERLETVVAENDKRRFEFDDSRRRIRARQGHSVEVDLGYEPVEPPETLYHGTIAPSLEKIREEGLRSMGRHHVHLSETIDDAKNVGRRRGEPVVLRVSAERMAADGYAFFCTPNGVWLVDAVPPEYLERLESNFTR